MRNIAVALVALLLGLEAFCGFALGHSRHLSSEGAEFNYQAAGSDWPETFPGCGGKQQSPINVISTEARRSSKDLTARIINFGSGREVKVQNTGQSVHCSWKDEVSPVVLLPVIDGEVSASIDPLDPKHRSAITSNTNLKKFAFANVQLKQFHFHISSENAINGVLFPMEAHIVATVPKEEVPKCGDDGCTVVFSVLFEISEEDNEFLEPLLEAAPVKAGEEYEVELPEDFTVDFNALVPREKTYYTWKGSLTTPPCTENIVWIMFDHMNTLSVRQLTLLQSKMAAVRNTCQEEALKDDDVEEFMECNNMGDLKNNRALQPLNGRTVSHSTTNPPSR